VLPIEYNYMQIMSERMICMNYEFFIAERIAQLRVQKGVSARDMSLSIGQSENYTNMIENRRALPSMSMFFFICEYLGVSPQDFFDAGNSNPKLLNDLIATLKTLDEDALSNLLAITRKMVH